MAPPFISVIINTYNYGCFIEETIDSVLAQDFPADQLEILVVDDGSTDDTAERVKKYGDCVRYFYKENGDQCSAVTFGVGQAKGDLIALLDGDDLWLPNKLSRVANEFANDLRTVMVYHGYLYWDSRDDSTWEEPAFANISGNVLADRRKLLTYTAAPTSALVFRRDAFQPLTRVPLVQGYMYDTFLFTAVLFLGPVACVPEILTKYRVHGKNRWAAGGSGPDTTTLKRRISRRKATNEILRNWIWANAAGSSRPRARILLRRSQVILDLEEFTLARPGRLRSFQHACRCAFLEEPTSRAHISYRYLHACAGMIVGERARYLEGIRTRINQMRTRWRRHGGAERTGEAPGTV